MLWERHLSVTRAYFEQTTEKIIKAREWTKDSFGHSGSYLVIPKATLFLPCNPDVSGVELFEALKKNDIYVRHFGKPALDQRISAYHNRYGEQMHKLIEFSEKNI